MRLKFTLISLQAEKCRRQYLRGGILKKLTPGKSSKGEHLEASTLVRRSNRGRVPVSNASCSAITFRKLYENNSNSSGEGRRRTKLEPAPESRATLRIESITGIRTNITAGIRLETIIGIGPVTDEGMAAEPAAKGSILTFSPGHTLLADKRADARLQFLQLTYKYMHRIRNKRSFRLDQFFFSSLISTFARLSSASVTAADVITIGSIVVYVVDGEIRTEPVRYVAAQALGRSR
ncbi:hypothetical protein EVAR_7001_1 [Eumeta japonica]|uniref:Uncharacterized protein n=1 Tax=Eumeta variegata TaxID=151549 RepID=A0A4C1THR2_EUMVA|nr:hypothetical protein EVAR_7001_1 [Eumeta japonica]